MKLIDFLNDWLENHHREYVKHQTYIRYKSNIETYVRPSKLGQIELSEVTRKDIQEFVNTLKKTKGRRTGKCLTAGTINNTYIVVQCAFRFAEDYELISSNPCVRIRRATEEKRIGKIKCFSIEEQKKIENYIDKTQDKILYAVLTDLYTGLRIGELCALKWSDIDFEKRTLTVNNAVYSSKGNDGKWMLMTDTPKTKTSARTIPLPAHIVKLFSKMWKQSKGDYVFERDDGEIVNPWILRWRYEEMLKKIGLKHLNFHCLRHTFATRALENGIDIKTLSEVLGHASPSITLNVYTHSMEDHKREMMDKMKRLR